MTFEARCPDPGVCHTVDLPDFAHYCESAGVQPGEEPQAFAAWLNAVSGWDGDMRRLD